MDIIDPSVEIITPLEWIRDYPRIIELCGRTCYKSEDRITIGSSDKFIETIMKSGHHSVIEHMSITVKFIGDRSMSHQLVRHRLAAYSQESQRYCSYGKKGFTFVCPPTIRDDSGLFEFWCKKRLDDIREYELYINNGVPPEDARSVLPNAMKTEVVTTYNLRQWRHVFAERALNPKAQWQIRMIMGDCLREFGRLLPSIFGDQLYELTREKGQ